MEHRRLPADVGLHRDPDYASFAWAVAPRAVDSVGRVRRGYLFVEQRVRRHRQRALVQRGRGRRCLRAGALPGARLREPLHPGQRFRNRQLLRRHRTHSGCATWTRSRTSPRRSRSAQYRRRSHRAQRKSPERRLLWAAPAGATVGLDLFARGCGPSPATTAPPTSAAAGSRSACRRRSSPPTGGALPNVYLYDYRVALGDGRYLHNDFDYAQGYWWSDYQVGSYYEKVWATYYLSEAFDNFISSAKEDFYDSRYKNVSFNTVFPKQVQRLYSALLTGDLDSFALGRGQAELDETPLGTLTYPTWHDAADIGTRPPSAMLADPTSAGTPSSTRWCGAQSSSTTWSSAWVHEARIAVFAHRATGLARRRGDQVLLPAERTHLSRSSRRRRARAGPEPGERCGRAHAGLGQSLDDVGLRGRGRRGRGSATSTPTARRF